MVNTGRNHRSGKPQERHVHLEEQGRRKEGISNEDGNEQYWPREKTQKEAKKAVK